MAMIGAEEYRFTGGDGQPHRVDRRNRLFELYPGTIGMKTELTERAGRCLVAAATRDGRTMLAVMFDASDMYASAAILLDRELRHAGGRTSRPTTGCAEVATGAALDLARGDPWCAAGALRRAGRRRADRLGLHDRAGRRRRGALLGMFLGAGHPPPDGATPVGGGRDAALPPGAHGGRPPAAATRVGQPGVLRPYRRGRRPR